MSNHTRIEGKLLIATSKQDGSWLEKAVIFIVEDSKVGSMGLIINEPDSRTIEDILQDCQFSNDISRLLDSRILKQKLLFGGPIDMEDVLILHQPASNWPKKAKLQNSISILIYKDFLDAVSSGFIPEKMIFCLGFSSWKQGELQREVERLDWITIPANESYIFEVSPEEKYEVAIDIAKKTGKYQ